MDKVRKITRGSVGAVGLALVNLICFYFSFFQFFSLIKQSPFNSACPTLLDSGGGLFRTQIVQDNI